MWKVFHVLHLVGERNTSMFHISVRLTLKWLWHSLTLCELWSCVKRWTDQASCSTENMIFPYHLMCMCPILLHERLHDLGLVRVRTSHTVSPVYIQTWNVNNPKLGSCKLVLSLMHQGKLFTWQKLAQCRNTKDLVVFTSIRICYLFAQWKQQATYCQGMSFQL